MPPPDEEIAELLAEMRPWLGVQARRLIRGNTHADWRDVAQEGWIAGWEAAQSWNGASSIERWMRSKALWRMYSFLRVRRQFREQPFAVAEEREFGFDPWADLAVLDDDEGAALAYHRAEILDAIREIPPRQQEYVLRSFFLGESYTEVAEAMGVENLSVYWSHRKYGARKRLREALAHLDPAGD